MMDFEKDTRKEMDEIERKETRDFFVVVAVWFVALLGGIAWLVL